MEHDRRRHRSSLPGEALSLVLEAEVTRSRADAVVLADLDGFLVAGAGASVDHQHVAAFAALAHDPRTHSDRLRTASFGPLRVTPIRVHGTSLLCAAVGAASLDVSAVEAAAKRIISDSHLS